MNLKRHLYCCILLLSFSVNAQMETDTVAIKKDNRIHIILDSIKSSPKITVLDSIKNTFVKHNSISSIDSLWMKELSNKELSDLEYHDVENLNFDEKVAYDLPTDVLKERLKLMDAKSPFNIEYNVGLENVIKSLLKGRKKSYERLLAISQYYFPMFEEALAKYNIPLEIKYLAIVESALNPKAKSRVGATGLWQFMYGTGLQYKLDINSYVDERSDPLKATEAACKYLSGMYAIFGDWDLVLASYNCGPGNVTKAIRRSGGLTNYWNIRKNLPKETAGYLPAFLATMYIFEYHKEHGINTLKSPVNYFATDTLMVKHQLSFNQISKLIDIPIAELQFLNPSYKLDVIPYVEKQHNYLRLPKEKSAIFASNEDKIYFYADYESNLREKPMIEVAKTKDTATYSYTTQQKWVTKYKSYRVKRGDNLAEIAIKFGVSSNDLKKWNHLRSNTVSRGRNIKIITNENIAVRVKQKVIPVSKTIETKTTEYIAIGDPTSGIQTKSDPKLNNISPTNTPKEEIVYHNEKVISYKDITKIYKVKKGDNLGEIADKYDVTMSEIKKWNKLKSNNVQKGKSLKIITNEKIVTIVRKKEKKQIEQIATLSLENKTKKDEMEVVDSKKSLDYVVLKGENFWTICKKFNLTATQLKLWNDLKENKLAIGSRIIVSENSFNKFVSEKALKEDKKIAESRKQEQLYLVKKGDSLFSISRKYPGVTISDLKKWNDIRDGEIKPGMKLKISG